MTPPTATAQFKASLAAARGQAWLETQLETVWQDYFGDVARLNRVTIAWSRVARYRLGSITAKGKRGTNPDSSEIRINPLLQHQNVPVSVVIQTVAHELTHYSHGFCSPHAQKYPHPHRGRVVERELIRRGLGDVYLEASRWIKRSWRDHVANTLSVAPRRRQIRSPYGTIMSFLSHYSTRGASQNRLGKRR